MAGVKSGKLSRSDRALQTRRRMLDSARELFVTQGYAATTMERIADDAGVAVQTLYYSFRTKGQLLCEVVEATAAGEDDAVPVTQRPWMQEMLGATSGPRVLALTVEHGADIFVRAAPLWPAVAAATSDPYVDRYWRGVAAGRREGQARMVARLADLGALRDRLTRRPSHRHRRHTLRTRRIPQSGQRGHLECPRIQGVAPHHARATAAPATQTRHRELLRPLLCRSLCQAPSSR